MDESVIEEEMKIAEERHSEGAKVLNDVMIREPIRRVPPRQPAICVFLGEPVANAILKMNAHKAGCVLVCQGDRLMGIITERDILRKTTGGQADPDQLRVEELMTPDPEVLGLDDPIVFALNKMGVGGFRHVPLVDDYGHPVGVLSIRHIIRYMVRFFDREVMNLPPEPGKDVARSREGA